MVEVKLNFFEVTMTMKKNLLLIRYALQSSKTMDSRKVQKTDLRKNKK